MGHPVVTGVSVATHDKTAAAWSAEFMTLNNLPAGYIVLGDPSISGFTSQHRNTIHWNKLDTQPVGVQQRMHCLATERTIGASQLKWQLQQFRENRIVAKTGVAFAAECRPTLAAAVLHKQITYLL